jgi:hypothetical protein
MSALRSAVAAGLAGEADQNEVPNQAASLKSTLADSDSPASKEILLSRSHSGSDSGNHGVDAEKFAAKENALEGDATATGLTTGADESGVLTGAKLYLVFLSLMLCVFVSRSRVCVASC